MTDFQSLIAQAIATLDKIAAHNDFCTLLEEERWEYPSTSLIQCRECLEDLRETHEKYLEDTKNERSSNPNDAYLISCTWKFEC